METNNDAANVDANDTDTPQDHNLADTTVDAVTPDEVDGDPTVDDAIDAEKIEPEPPLAVTGEEEAASDPAKEEDPSTEDAPQDDAFAENPTPQASFGDDPDPLPRGFRVIDGAATDDEPVQIVTDLDEGGVILNDAADAQAEPLPVISAETPVAEVPQVRAQADAADNEPRPSVGDAAAGLLSSVGSLISTGAEAMRQVNAAKKAHEAARDELAALTRTIRERTEELEHRREVEASYPQIIATQQTALITLNGTIDQAKAKQLEISQIITAKKEELARTEDADAKVLKKLKKEQDKAESAEKGALESYTRLQRRLDDVTGELNAAEAERAQEIDAAKTAAKQAEEHLAALRAEFAEVQRNPSANPAQYSVRSAQLQTDISDAMEAIRSSQNAIPAIEAAGTEKIEQAKQQIKDAKKPVDKAKKLYDAAHEDAEKARLEMARGAKAAEGRKRDLEAIIEGYEKALREQERTALEAQQQALQAQSVIDEAEDVHEHPEVTATLVNALAADHAEADELETRIEDLAHAEEQIREQTKSSRTKFTVAIAAAIAVILLLIIAFVVL